MKAELSGTSTVACPVRDVALDVRSAPAKLGLSIINEVKLDNSGKAEMASTRDWEVTHVAKVSSGVMNLVIDFMLLLSLISIGCTYKVERKENQADSLGADGKKVIFQRDRSGKSMQHW